MVLHRIMTGGGYRTSEGGGCDAVSTFKIGFRVYTYLSTVILELYKHYNILNRGRSLYNIMLGNSDSRTAATRVE